MGLLASDSGGGGYEPMPAGMYAAYCDLIADIGMQEGAYGAKHQILIRWAVPLERFIRDGEDEGPRVVSNRFTLSLNEKSNLAKMLEGWRGRKFSAEERKTGFDVFKVLGAPCMLTITHVERKGNIYANVTAVGPLPKGHEKPEPEGKLLKFSAEEPQDFDLMPEWIQGLINKGAGTKTVLSPPVSEAGKDFDDDIPF